MLPIYPRETHVGEELAGCQGPLPPNPSHPPLCGAKALGFQEQDGGGSRGWDSGETVAPPFSDHCRCPALSWGSSPEQESPAQGSTGAPGRAGCFLPRCPPTPSWCVLSPPLGVSLRRPGPARPSGQSGSSLTSPPASLSQARKGCQVRGLGRGGRILGWVASTQVARGGCLPPPCQKSNNPGQPAPKPVYHGSPRERFWARADKQTEAPVWASRLPFQAPGRTALPRPSLRPSRLAPALHCLQSPHLGTENTAPHPASFPVPV